MKFLLVLASLLALSTAGPAVTKIDQLESPDSRFIEAILESLLEGLKEQIIDEGFDPFVINSYDDQCVVLDLLTAKVHIQDLVAAGVTNIIINRVQLLLTGIDLDLSLTPFTIDLGNIDAGLTALGGVIDLNLAGNGSIAIYGAGVSGFVFVDLAQGLNIEGINLQIRLERIESNVVTILNGQDYSAFVNNLLNVTILDLLRVYGDQIHEVLDVIVMRIVESILNDLQDPLSFKLNLNRNLEIPLCEIIDFVLDFIRDLDLF